MTTFDISVPGQASQEAPSAARILCDAYGRRGSAAIRIGERADAIALPGSFGAQVVSHLVRWMFTPVILRYPVPHGRWIFLTQPVTPASDLEEDEFVCARRLSPGAELVLPPGTVDGSPVKWVLAPDGEAPLPPWQAVLNAMRSAV
ncbi:MULTISPECIES: hypothetical protein [Amycolatopsis]|uniref:Uncharacterized protein n=1 Tax=Amycolatopsis albidoflavus TaxID=102226 RepID=A0ABW5I7V4_9PSEU